MEGSKIGFQSWMIVTYLMTTSLKGVSSMKLHRDLDINQCSTWFLGYRLRALLTEKGGLFNGPVEVDETYVGGKRKELTGRGAVGKAVAVGAKDRETNKVRAQAVKSPDAKTYEGLPFNHESVKHSLSEHVRGDEFALYSSSSS